MLQSLRAVLVNPIIMGTVLGILVAASGVTLPAVVDRTLVFIGQAAAPSALFALGATLSLRRLAGSLGPAGLMLACKLFVHPLLAWLAFAWLLELDPLWVNAGVIFAACPVGPQRLRLRPTLRGRDRDRLQRDPDLDRARHGDHHHAPGAAAAAHALGGSGSQSPRIRSSVKGQPEGSASAAAGSPWLRRSSAAFSRASR